MNDDGSSSWTNSMNLGSLITSLCNVHCPQFSLNFVQFFIPNFRRKRGQSGRGLFGPANPKRQLFDGWGNQLNSWFAFSGFGHGL